MSVRVRTKWSWVRITLLSLLLIMFKIFCCWCSNSLKILFLALWVAARWNVFFTCSCHFVRHLGLRLYSRINFCPGVFKCISTSCFSEFFPFVDSAPSIFGNRRTGDIIQLISYGLHFRICPYYGRLIEQK